MCRKNTINGVGGEELPDYDSDMSLCVDQNVTA